MATDSGPHPPPPSASLLPHNPYAPPAAVGAPPPEPEPESNRDGAPPFGRAPKWMYVGAAAGEYVAIAGMLLSSARATALLAQGFSTLAFWVGNVTALVWLHAAWRARPFPRAHRDVSPGGAVGRLFIPFYGSFYWMFAANLELSASVEHFPLGNRNGRGSLDLANVAMIAGGLQILTSATGFLTVHAPSTRGYYLVLGLRILRTGAWLLFMFVWERRRARALASR